MKTKKAVKRLTRVETLLSDILKEYSKGEKLVRESLGAAKASVGRALESISALIPPAADKKAKKSKKSAGAAKKKAVAAKKADKRSAAPVAKKGTTKAKAPRKPARPAAKRRAIPVPSTEPSSSMAATSEF